MLRNVNSFQFYSFLMICFYASSCIANVKLSEITFLDFNEEQRVIVSSNLKKLICLRRPAFLEWIFLSFKKQLLSIEFTSHTLHIPRLVIKRFNSVDELQAFQLYDVGPRYGRSVHETRGDSPDVFTLEENGMIPLSGMHAHCFALTLRHDDSISYISCNLVFLSFWDMARIFKLLLGMFLYLIAPILSESVCFYYISGMSLSVVGSIFIIFILILRLFSNRSSIILQGLLLFSGSTLSLLVFCLEYFRSILWSIASRNLSLVVLYTILVSIFTCCLFYYFNLPDSFLYRFPFTKSLTKGLFRLVGVFLFATAPVLPHKNLTLRSFFNFINTHAVDHLQIDLNPLFSSIEAWNFTNRIILAILVVPILHFLAGCLKRSDYGISAPNLSSLRHKNRSFTQPPSPLQDVGADYYWPPPVNPAYMSSPYNENWQDAKYDYSSPSECFTPPYPVPGSTDLPFPPFNNHEGRPVGWLYPRLPKQVSTDDDEEDD